MIDKIISGGQTGADQQALKTAKWLGIPTGGWAAKGWLTESGPAPWLADYNLTEPVIGGYPFRTAKNVKDSDGTAIFGDLNSKGSRLAQLYCRQESKPWIGNPDGGELRRWCGMNGIKVLNVAGNRESVNPEITVVVHDVLVAAFGREV